MNHARAFAATAESTGLSRTEQREQKLLSLRLPPSDVSTLRFLFGGLESEVGLRSNFGAMCERLAQVNDGTKNFAVAVSSSQIHVKSAPPCLRITSSPIERWACWSNHLEGSLGTYVLEAREALVTMVDNNESDMVLILYKMYGGITPARFASEYRGLGDLVPLAIETCIVQAHAAKMTASLRHQLAVAAGAQPRPIEISPSFAESDRSARMADRRETVTGHAALRALLDRPCPPEAGKKKTTEYTDKVRRVAENERAIKAEAHALLVSASHAYRRAKDAA